jgi:hypothetical protein
MRLQVEEKAERPSTAENHADAFLASDDEADDEVIWRQRSSEDDEDDEEDGEEWEDDDDDDRRDDGAAWPLSPALTAEVDGMTLPSQVEGWQRVQRCLRDALTAAMASAPLFEPAVVELILNSYVAPASFHNAYLPILSLPSPQHSPLPDTASKFGGMECIASPASSPPLRLPV